MALEDILEKIKQDATDEIARIQADTTNECNRIQSAMAEKIQVMQTDERARIATRATLTKERALTLAAIDLKKDRLQARQNKIEAAFTQARKAIADFDTDTYHTLIRALVEKAKPVGSVVIVTDANTKSVFGDVFLKQLNQGFPNASFTLSEETRDTHGGFYLVQGKTEMNFSTQALLHELRSDLQKNIADILFKDN